MAASAPIAPIPAEENGSGLNDVFSGRYLAEHSAECISLFGLHDQKEAILSKETINVPYLRPLLKMGINRSFLAGANLDHSKSYNY